VTAADRSRLPGEVWRAGDPLRDAEERWPAEESHRSYDDGFVSVRVDTVCPPEGDSFVRSVVEHRGAVGVVALDDAGRVLLLRQYRHAAGRRLLQLPAGMCDVPDEAAAVTAARELREEAHLVAADWRILLDVVPTPGSSSERWGLFLARDLQPVAEADRYRAEHEEADMTAVWVPLDEAVNAVLDRRLTDGMAGIALLAAHRHRSLNGWDTLPAAEPH